MGMGLAFRWAYRHEIYVGSRSREKAEASANEYIKMMRSRGVENARITGVLNEEAVRLSELVVFTVPYEPGIELARTLSRQFEDKIVISPLVPLVKDGGLFFHSPLKGPSAAEELREAICSGARVVSALHTVPAGRLVKEGPLPSSDVIVCGDEKESKGVVMELVREIERLRPVDGGPLRASRLVEALVPLLLNLSHISKFREPMVKFI